MEKLKNLFSNVQNWVKAHLVPTIAVVCSVVIIILLASLFIKTPKKVVKSYINAFNKANASKIVKLSDLKAQRVLLYVTSSFDKEDYNKFIEDYKDYDKEIEEDDTIDSLEKVFDKLGDEYKSYKLKLDEVKSVKKVGKNFYIVKAKISLVAKPKDKDKEKIDETNTVTFAVYKNKMATGISAFY